MTPWRFPQNFPIWWPAPRIHTQNSGSPKCDSWRTVELHDNYAMSRKLVLPDLFYVCNVFEGAVRTWKILRPWLWWLSVPTGKSIHSHDHRLLRPATSGVSGDDVGTRKSTFCKSEGLREEGNKGAKASNMAFWGRTMKLSRKMLRNMLRPSLKVITNSSRLVAIGRWSRADLSTLVADQSPISRRLVANCRHWALFAPLFMSFGTVVLPVPWSKKGKRRNCLTNSRLGLEQTKYWGACNGSEFQKRTQWLSRTNSSEFGGQGLGNNNIFTSQPPKRWWKP